MPLYFCFTLGNHKPCLYWKLQLNTTSLKIFIIFLIWEWPFKNISYMRKKHIYLHLNNLFNFSSNSLSCFWFKYYPILLQLFFPSYLSFRYVYSKRDAINSVPLTLTTILCDWIPWAFSLVFFFYFAACIALIFNAKMFIKGSNLF